MKELKNGDKIFKINLLETKLYKDLNKLYKDLKLYIKKRNIIKKKNQDDKTGLCVPSLRIYNIS